MQYSAFIVTYISTLLFFLAFGIAHSQETKIIVKIPDIAVPIDPMIYGQMLENVNDSMIYGGITDRQGNIRKHLIPPISDLQIPVLRWPGGTVVYEYDWKSGIGPKDKRPIVPNLAWGGTENYQFGTDEFLQWCQQVGTTPYINVNMSLHPKFQTTVTEAMEWMEYVNGDQSTKYGQLRAQNGHKEPYRVLYWGIGNENYLPNRAGRIQESDVQYAARLKQWAGTIKQHYPDLHLLGIGRSLQWNRRVLDSCGQLIDFLTQHYYVTSRVKDGKIQDPASSLFAPAKMEAHLSMLGAQLDTINKQLGRAYQPVRLSIDEWNNRHSVDDGERFQFTRQSPRRQFDVAVVAGMLNVFIRQSPHVGMANYIFPVNAHGLIRTIGNNDAYQTPIYHVFKQYRQQLTGSKLDVIVQGPSIAAADIYPTIEGDSDEVQRINDLLTYIDAAAVLNSSGHIQVSLVNRSHERSYPVTIEAPKGYGAQTIWMLAHPNINAANSSDQPSEISPVVKPIKEHHGTFTTEIPAGGLYIIQYISKK